MANLLYAESARLDSTGSMSSTNPHQHTSNAPESLHANTNVGARALGDHTVHAQSTADLNGSRCSSPQSVPTLDNDSDGTYDCTTLSDVDATDAPSTPGHETGPSDVLGNTLQPTAAPNMLGQLNAQTLMLHNSLGNAAIAFDPLAAWHMSSDDPWNPLMRRDAGKHAADLQARTDILEANIMGVSTMI